MVSGFTKLNCMTFGEPREGLTAEDIREGMILWCKKIRDAELIATDKYLLQDFPVSDEEREQWRAYRLALRDLPDNWPDPFVKTEEDYVDLSFWPEHPTIPEFYP